MSCAVAVNLRCWHWRCYCKEITGRYGLFEARYAPPVAAEADDDDDDDDDDDSDSDDDDDDDDPGEDSNQAPARQTKLNHRSVATPCSFALGEQIAHKLNGSLM